jgi:hypothetical protein
MHVQYICNTATDLWNQEQNVKPWNAKIALQTYYKHKLP